MKNNNYFNNFLLRDKEGREKREEERRERRGKGW